MFSGEHSLTDDSETMTVIRKANTTGRKKHPRFFIKADSGELKYDVALLELENPLVFGQNNIPQIR